MLIHVKLLTVVSLVTLSSEKPKFPEKLPVAAALQRLSVQQSALDHYSTFIS